MRDPQVFFNILTNNSYLLISAVGMTLVILSGGIDLSVSGVVALTTVATAAMLREGANPWLVVLVDAADGDGAGRDDGRVHCLFESAALHRDAGGHVVCPGDVLLHQRRCHRHRSPVLPHPVPDEDL